MAHAWRFFRAGGVDQVQITRGADLAKLGELDQKLWVALACPVEGLGLDARTLKLIDVDNDGRVRAQELISAAQWITSLLRDSESITKGSASLPIDAIDDKNPEGKELIAAAKALLVALGRNDAKELFVSDVAGATEAFGKQPFNGDGIVTAASARDEATRLALSDVIANSNAPLDRSGEKGASVDTLRTFFADVDAYVAWLDAGKGADVRVLGDATAVAHAALAAVRAKVNDYFGRTKIAAYDSRALTALNREQTEYVAIGVTSISGNGDEIEHFPLAHIEAGKPLPLKDGVNPAWASRLDALSTHAVTPVLGARTTLTADDWATLNTRLAAYDAWLARKPAIPAAALDEARARALSDPALRSQLVALVAEDEAERPKATLLDKVERLVYYHRDLFKLANNFVAFRTFYASKEKATFQYGRLFIDQRECDLVLRVFDPAKHATLAPLSNCYLLYCDIKNAKGEKQAIVAALTNGDSDNLMVGRNGVFYDRDGKDWDATVTKIVDHPISVRAAFWSPYKKALRAIEAFVAKRAAAAEAESDKKMGNVVTATESAVDGAPKAVKPPTKLDIGVVAAFGVAVGGLTAALGAIMQAFFGLGLWMPLGVLGVMLVISGPSMAVAWLKLRQRNIAPLLDANGWAINSHAKLNVAFGAALTQVPRLPEGATRDLTDPFEEKRRPWLFYVFMLIVIAGAVAWYLGKLDVYLPVKARSVEVLGAAAPARVRLVEEPATSTPAPAPTP